MNLRKFWQTWFPNYSCMACGKEIDSSPNPHICRKCLDRLPMFDEIMTTNFAPFHYAEPVRGMILNLKYNANGLIAEAFAPYLAAVYLRFIKDDRTHWLVPVPLYRTRLNERGYNQSLLLAQALSEYIGAKIIDGALIRNRKTVIQKNMDAATRAANMSGAFTVLPERAAEINGRDILIIDDVYTTGSTTGKCAKALKAAGARSVSILTVAIAGNY